MTRLFKCTLKNQKGYVKESFYEEGNTAVEVFLKIKICNYSDGNWDIESISREAVIEENLGISGSVTVQI